MHALVIGESLIDIVLAPDGTETEHPGGSAANAAVALARLGRETQLLTAYAADDRGRALAAHLASAGVTPAADPEVLERTATATARINPDGSASYEFDIEWQVAGGELARPERVHVSSLAPVLDPGAEQVHHALDRLEGVPVSYDINCRPGITGAGADLRWRVERMVARCDLVKCSDEDLAVLYPHLGVGEAARHLRGSGPVAVVVTRGGQGATWFGEQVVDVPAERVEVVDTIGAGDTFGAALLDALWDADLTALDRDDIEHALGHAVAAAAVTVSRPGADPPYAHELTRELAPEQGQ